MVKVGSGDRDGLLATGDDDGYVKVWDTRQHNRAKQSQSQQAQHTAAAAAGEGKGQRRKRRKTGKPVELKAAAASQSTAVMSFAESGDYISDLLMSDSHLLLSSSGDGHLQVFDLRRAGSWYAQSEAVDDDLLSLCCVVKKRGKGSIERRRKVLVGSKESGVHVYSWDWFGRPDEHFAYPESADCIVELDTPATTANVIAIGSSEGSLGLCTLWPHTLHHTIGRHAGAQPVEAVRLSGRVTVRGSVGGGAGGWAGVEEGGERDSRWLVSAGHDKRIRLWDVTGVCEDGLRQEEAEDEDEEEEKKRRRERRRRRRRTALWTLKWRVVSRSKWRAKMLTVTKAVPRTRGRHSASHLMIPAAGGSDRAAAVAALKRKIAAAKQRKAAERKAAGRTEDSSSDEDDDSDEDDEQPHIGGKGAQQLKRKGGAAAAATEEHQSSRWQSERRLLRRSINEYLDRSQNKLASILRCTVHTFPRLRQYERMTGCEFSLCVLLELDMPTATFDCCAIVSLIRSVWQCVAAQSASSARSTVLDEAAAHVWRLMISRRSSSSIPAMRLSLSASSHSSDPSAVPRSLYNANS